jgi:hypothetical protein
VTIANNQLDGIPSPATGVSFFGVTVTTILPSTPTSLFEGFFFFSGSALSNFYYGSNPVSFVQGSGTDFKMNCILNNDNLIYGFTENAGSGSVLYGKTFGGEVPGSWTIRTFPASNTINAVAWGNGKYVAVGSSNTTGSIFCTDSYGTWSPAVRGGFCNSGTCVVYGNGLWVAGGVSNYDLGGRDLIYSLDGSNWDDCIGFNINILDVAYGGGVWVAVGNGEGACCIFGD